MLIFFRAYQRGDFPLVLSHTGRGCKLAWKVRNIRIWKTDIKHWLRDIRPTFVKYFINLSDIV